MDFDYVEDDRPRFQLASGPVNEQVEERKLDVKQVSVCAALGILAIGYGLAFGGSVVQFFAVWVGLALVVGPFAPASYTGGDCRVGVGEVLPADESDESAAGEWERRQGGRRRQENHVSRVQSRGSLIRAGLEKVGEGLKTVTPSKDDGLGLGNGEEASQSLEKGSQREEEWTAEEFEVLRKQMAKHPRGTARRWEIISASFEGAHRVDGVIKMAKALAERKPADDNAYAQFLAHRKCSNLDISSPPSQREANGTNGIASHDACAAEPATSGGKDKSLLWSEEDDKALLNALKMFPKDTATRWDKVSGAVHGKSKPQCFRRFAELRSAYRGKKGVEAIPDLE